MSKIDLNSRKSIASLDKSNLLGSIEALDKQIEHAWAETRKIKFTATAKIENVVVAGMGGSALGADVIKNLFKKELRVPFEIVRDYSLPGYVNEHSLVILSSYSGTTEETLACGAEVIKYKAQAMVIAAGGELIELAKTNHWSYYLINPLHNPSNQPRMAIGYSIFGIFGLLEKAGVISLSPQQIQTTLEAVRQQKATCTVEVKTESNPAKILAFQLIDKQAILIAPDFLAGATHVATNQSNENAKTLTTYHVIPELNHHLLEALSFPDAIRTNSIFILINSKLAQPINQKRVKLTGEILETMRLEKLSIDLEASNALAQCFELICLFSFVSLYQSLLENIDPSPIPNVQAFKQALHK